MKKNNKIKVSEADNQELWDCPNGCGLLHQNWQNVGFTPPEGAPHYEVEDYYCPACGFRTDNPEEINEED